MRNIILFSSSLSQGGAEKVLSLLSIKLSKKYKNTLVVYNADRIDYNFSGKLISLKTRQGKNITSKIRAFYYRVKEMKVIKIKEKVEVTISFLDSPNLVNLFSRCNDKVVLSVRNFKVKKKLSIYDKIFRTAMKRYYNKADVVVAVSKLIKNDLIDHFKIDEDKVVVIYNPYNIKQINNLAKEAIPEAEERIFRKPTLINVGRLNTQKGQKYLIEMMNHLRVFIPDIQLVILGEGTLEGELKKQVELNGLSGNVHFLGFKKNPYKYISKSDLFVFPSLHEGFPNALVEAMACATPVISADCKSGPREILAPGTDIYKQTETSERAKYGVLMPVIDDNDENPINVWVDEIKLLLNDKETLENYSVLSKERVQEFNSEKVIEEWEKVIEGQFNDVSSTI